MLKCEFSEDAYEQNLVCDLRSTYGPWIPHFKPSRSLEAYVAVDFGINSYYPPFSAYSGMWIAKLLDLIDVPSTYHSQLDDCFVTALVQCKVPGRAQRAKAKYPFRFKIDQDQCNTLCDVEVLVRNRVVVRYGTPCFHTMNELRLCVVQREMATRSHFVSPADLRDHSTYHYSTPDQAGVARSEPTPVTPAPLLAGIEAALQEATPERFTHHLFQLWSTLSLVAERHRFRVDLEHYVAIADLLIRERRLDGDEPIPTSKPAEKAKWPDGAEIPTLRSYLSGSIGVSALARDFLNARALTFGIPRKK